jgi:hypothetical protein
MLKIIIICIIIALLSVWFIRYILSDIHSTAFTLLKSSPEIDRKENIAFKFILVGVVVFLLLLITSWF